MCATPLSCARAAEVLAGRSSRGTTRHDDALTARLRASTDSIRQRDELARSAHPRASAAPAAKVHTHSRARARTHAETPQRDSLSGVCVCVVFELAPPSRFASMMHDYYAHANRAPYKLN